MKILGEKFILKKPYRVSSNKPFRIIGMRGGDYVTTPSGGFISRYFLKKYYVKWEKP